MTASPSHRTEAKRHSADARRACHHAAEVFRAASPRSNTAGAMTNSEKRLPMTCHYMHLSKEVLHIFNRFFHRIFSTFLSKNAVISELSEYKERFPTGLCTGCGKFVDFFNRLVSDLSSRFDRSPKRSVKRLRDVPRDIHSSPERLSSRRCLRRDFAAEHRI